MSGKDIYEYSSGLRVEYNEYAGNYVAICNFVYIISMYTYRMILDKINLRIYIEPSQVLNIYK